MDGQRAVGLGDGGRSSSERGRSLSIWDAADPYGWNTADSGSAGNFPVARIEAAADATPPGCTLGTTCYDTEHDNTKVYGVDH